MKRTIFASAALMFLAAGGSAMAQKHGGDKGDKHDRSAQGQGQRSEGKKQDRAPQVRAAVQQQQQQRVARQEQQRAIRDNQRVIKKFTLFRRSGLSWNGSAQNRIASSS